MEATHKTVQERRIGFVFQSYALFNHMTVAQNVAFGIRIRKLPIDSAARCYHSAAHQLLQNSMLPIKYSKNLYYPSNPSKPDPSKHQCFVVQARGNRLRLVGCGKHSHSQPSRVLHSQGACYSATGCCN